MTRKIKSFSLGCALLGGFFISSGALAETMLRSQGLLSAPNAKSTITAKVKMGEVVRVLQKKGFWVEVESAHGVGWTQLNTVRTSSGTTGLASLETGRLANANIVSSSGIRGLDGGDLEQARPDKREFAKLAAYAQSTERAQSFANAGQLKTRQLDYLTNRVKRRFNIKKNN